MINWPNQEDIARGMAKEWPALEADLGFQREADRQFRSLLMSGRSAWDEATFRDAVTAASKHLAPVRLEQWGARP